MRETRIQTPPSILPSSALPTVSSSLPADAGAMDTSTEPHHRLTQPTQPASQSAGPVADTELWGALLPTNPKVVRVDFLRSQGTYRVGRHSTCDIVLNNLKISNFHCTIQCKDPNDERSEVQVADHSTNGTFVRSFRYSCSVCACATRASASTHEITRFFTITHTAAP